MGASDPTPAPTGVRPPAARITHRTRRRLRLRVPSRRHDHDFFAALEQRLGAIENVESVLAEPATAGLLLRFAEGDGDGIAVAVEGLGLLSLEQASRTRGSPSTPAIAGGAQGWLAALCGERIDRRRIALVLLVLLVLRRLLRSGWLAPALAFAWLLHELRQARERRC